MSEALDLPATTSNQLAGLIIPGQRAPGERSVPAVAHLPYNIEISEWQTRPAKHEPGVGYLQTSMVYLADGSQYVFRKIQAEHPISDISADFMPPLATRTKGFNKYVGRRAAAAGINSRLVGTNRGHKYSLEHDAQAFITILNHDDETDPTSQTGVSLELGYSMGAMKALGAFSLAHLMNREHAGILVDPCLAEPIDYSKENLREVLPYLMREIRETAHIVRGDAQSDSWAHTLVRSKDLLGTFSLSPTFLRNMYDKWRIIATGEAGTFPPKVPTDAAIILHFFKGSRYNDKETYRQLFSNHENVRIVEEDGLHMTGGCPAFIDETVAQAQIAVQLMEEGVTKTELADALDRSLVA